MSVPPEVKVAGGTYDRAVRGLCLPTLYAKGWLEGTLTVFDGSETSHYRVTEYDKDTDQWTAVLVQHETARPTR